MDVFVPRNCSVDDLEVELEQADDVVVGLRRDLDLSMPLIDVCGAMGARRLDPWVWTFGAGI